MKFAIVRALIVPLLVLLVSAPAVAFAAEPTVQFQSLDQSYILPRLSARCGFPVLKQVTGTMCKLQDRTQHDSSLKFGTTRVSFLPGQLPGSLRGTGRLHGSWIARRDAPQDAELYGALNYPLLKAEGLDQRPDCGIAWSSPRYHRPRATRAR